MSQRARHFYISHSSETTPKQVSVQPSAVSFLEHRPFFLESVMSL